jgi:hypothetical protein
MACAYICTASHCCGFNAYFLHWNHSNYLVSYLNQVFQMLPEDSRLCSHWVVICSVALHSITQLNSVICAHNSVRLPVVGQLKSCIRYCWPSHLIGHAHANTVIICVLVNFVHIFCLDCCCQDSETFDDKTAQSCNEHKPPDDHQSNVASKPLRFVLVLPFDSGHWWIVLRFCG